MFVPDDSTSDDQIPPSKNVFVLPPDRKDEDAPTGVHNAGKSPYEVLNRIVIQVETFNPSGKIKMSTLNESRGNSTTRKLSNDTGRSLYQINPDLELTFGYLGTFRNKLQNLCVDISNFIRTSPNLTKEMEVRQEALEELLMYHSSIRIHSHFLGEIWKEIERGLAKILSAVSSSDPNDYFVTGLSEDVQRLRSSLEFLPKVRAAVAEAFIALMKDKHLRFDMKTAPEQEASLRALDKEDNEKKFKVSTWTLKSACVVLRERLLVLVRNLTVLAEKTGMAEKAMEIYEAADGPGGPKTSLSQLGLIANNLLDSFSESEERVRLLVKQLDHLKDGSRRAVAALRTLLQDIKRFNSHFDNVHRGLQVFLNLTTQLYYHDDEPNELDDVILETVMKKIQSNVTLVASVNGFLRDRTRNLLRSHASNLAAVKQLPGIRNALLVLQQVIAKMNQTIDDALSLVLHPPYSFSLNGKSDKTNGTEKSKERSKGTKRLKHKTFDRSMTAQRPEKRFYPKPKITVHFPWDAGRKRKILEADSATDRPELKIETITVASTPSSDTTEASDSSEVDFGSNFTNPFQFFMNALNLYSDQVEENSHDKISLRSFVDENVANNDESLSYF